MDNPEYVAAEVNVFAYDFVSFAELTRLASCEQDGRDTPPEILYFLETRHVEQEFA